MKYSKGIMWLDDCRIPFVDGGWGMRKNANNEKKHDDYGHNKIDQIQNQQGRFTPNLLVCDDMLNDGSITQGTKTKVIDELNKNYEGWGMNKKKQVEKSDKGTNSRYYDLDLWFVKMLEKL